MAWRSEQTVGWLFDLGRGSRDAGEPLRLRVAHQVFANALVCPACGGRREFSLRLLGRLSQAEQTCAACRQRMRAPANDLIEWLSEADLPAPLREARLQRLGFRRGDVVTVAGAARTAHFQIGA